MAPTGNTKTATSQRSVSIKTPATTCHVFMNPAVPIPPGRLEIPQVILQSLDLASLFNNAGALVEARRRAQEQRNREAEAARARFAAD